MASIRKAKCIKGRTLVFRDASTEDAAFILRLRTDERKARYLSHTPADLERQRAWLEAYSVATDQAYFVIQSTDGERLGTVRLYDPQATSFCWGSWILKAGSPIHAAIESALIVYAYAIDHLGFERAHFDVRKNNKRVWQFHERFGAIRTGETECDYLYRIDADAVAASRERYKKYLPDPIHIND